MILLNTDYHLHLTYDCKIGANYNDWIDFSSQNWS